MSIFHSLINYTAELSWYTRTPYKKDRYPNLTQPTLVHNNNQNIPSLDNGVFSQTE